MPACKECNRYDGRPKPRCPEGIRIKKKVTQARIAFENGEGTKQEWEDAWDDWVRHYKGGKKKTKSKDKQTRF